MSPSTKQCTRCGEEKATSEFYRRGAGHSSWCKQCSSEYSSFVYSHKQRYCKKCGERKAVRWFPQEGRVCKKCLRKINEENRRLLEQKEAKERRLERSKMARSEARFKKYQLSSGNDKFKSLEDVKRMAETCRECGAAKIHRYGDAMQLHLCRECYRSGLQRHDGLVEYCDAHIQGWVCSTRYARLRRLETDRVWREFFREKREARGIYEPVIVCSQCKKAKPLFEFRIFHPPEARFLENIMCEECESFLWHTKTCPMCKKRKENEDFEDEDRIFYCCEDCRARAAHQKEIWLSCVDKSTLSAALDYRGMDCNEENAALVTELILAKRIRRELTLTANKARRAHDESGV